MMLVTMVQGANNNGAATSSPGAGQRNSDMSLNCQAIASTTGGIFVPNSNNAMMCLYPDKLLQSQDQEIRI